MEKLIYGYSVSVIFDGKKVLRKSDFETPVSLRDAVDLLEKLCSGGTVINRRLYTDRHHNRFV